MWFGVFILGTFVSALILTLLPYPYGAAVVAGGLLAALFRLSDRIDRVQVAAGVKEPSPMEGPNPGADAERDRIRRRMLEYEKQASEKR